MDRQKAPYVFNISESCCETKLKRNPRRRKNSDSNPFALMPMSVRKDGGVEVQYPKYHKKAGQWLTLKWEKGHWVVENLSTGEIYYRSQKQSSKTTQKSNLIDCSDRS